MGLDEDRMVQGDGAAPTACVNEDVGPSVLHICDGPGYGTAALHIYWREFTDSGGWGAAQMLPAEFATVIEPSATIGRLGEHGGAVVVGIRGTDNQVYFLRTNYPLITGSVWSVATLGPGHSTRRAPAVAARPHGSPRWLAAWTAAQTVPTST